MTEKPHAYEWISDPRDLNALIDELAVTDAYALDTEFHRERTYAPQLALVQVATRSRLALVDALAVDVHAFSRAFESSSLCVMHAGSQDLEILQLACGSIPRRIFDTQTAALFTGYRTSSLSKLVEELLEATLDKSGQLSDWTRRPLPPDDLAYAASDVAHLLELRDVLVQRLEAVGRLSWAEEEFERLRNRDRGRSDPDTLWWKLRGKSKLSGRARAVAQSLARWREEGAEERNRLPRTVLSDMALLALAQRPARKERDLKGVRNLDLKRFKDTDALLAAIARGLDMPRAEVRLPPRKPANQPQVEGVIALCVAWLGQRAKDEAVDPSVLGTRDDVTNFVLGRPSRLDGGWRWDLVGKELRSIIDGRGAVAVRGTELRLVDRMEP